MLTWKAKYFLTTPKSICVSEIIFWMCLFSKVKSMGSTARKMVSARPGRMDVMMELRILICSQRTHGSGQLHPVNASLLGDYDCQSCRCDSDCWCGYPVFTARHVQFTAKAEGAIALECHPQQGCQPRDTQPHKRQDQEPECPGAHRLEMQARPVEAFMVAGAPKCSVLTSVMTLKKWYLCSFWT